MKKLLMILVAVALLGAASETAHAGGGGGAKRSSTIRVNNNSALLVAVIIDNLGPPYTNANAFISLGGQVLFPGQHGNFKVANGVHTVVASPVTAVSPAITVGNQASVNTSVAKGRTRNVNITNTDPTNVFITPQ